MPCVNVKDRTYDVACRVRYPYVIQQMSTLQTYFKAAYSVATFGRPYAAIISTETQSLKSKTNRGQIARWIHRSLTNDPIQYDMQLCSKTGVTGL